MWCESTYSINQNEFLAEADDFLHIYEIDNNNNQIIKIKEFSFSNESKFNTDDLNFQIFSLEYALNDANRFNFKLIDNSKLVWKKQNGSGLILIDYNCKKSIVKNESEKKSVKKCIENIFKIENSSHLLVVKNCTHKINS